MTLEIKLSEGAKAPYRASREAAGYDLYSNEKLIINPHERKLVDTGFSMRIPEGCYGRIAPRSGLAVKKSVDIGAGVIDRDYRGPVKILIINNGRESFHIQKYDRIAQLILEKNIITDIEIVEELEETERGHGGFGSTGKN